MLNLFGGEQQCATEDQQHVLRAADGAKIKVDSRESVVRERTQQRQLRSARRVPGAIDYDIRIARTDIFFPIFAVTTEDKIAWCSYMHQMKQTRGRLVPGARERSVQCVRPMRMKHTRPAVDARMSGSYCMVQGA